MYGTFRTPGEPTFDLVEIEYGRTEQILLGHGLTADDLSDSQTLLECIDIRKTARFLTVSEQLNRD